MINRRDFMADMLKASLFTFLSMQRFPVFSGIAAQQRIIVFMIDGFGLDYLAASDMPNFRKMMQKGMYKEVKAVMPTVTNANNASICCGAWPEAHGITGNSYYDKRREVEEYMESGDLLLAPTLFEKAASAGIKSALISAKKKTIRLLSRGAELAVSPETAGEEWKTVLGEAPHIYSSEVNYWVMEAALHVLKTRKELQCLYVHTTDYPMHTWKPEEAQSKAHLAKLDEYIGKIAEAAPDAAILLTADHGLNHKNLCWDLEKACATRGKKIKIAISAERDKYLKHHRGFGGVSWVYLEREEDKEAVKQLLSGLKGVSKVMDREEAASEFRLMADRIGDLAVLGDKDTVFGNLEKESEDLPETFRTHGSVYEQQIPLLVYNAKKAPDAAHFQYNLHLTDWLYK